MKDIVNNCGYSSATFYRQYKDKYDLIAWAYTRDLELIQTMNRRMKKQQIFTEEHDGFIGAYYGGPADSKKAIILMLGDSSEDHMARCGADWVMKRGCHALKSLPSMRMC